MKPPSLEMKNSKGKKSFFRNVIVYFREYCRCTSVHGFRYLGENGRSFFERFWWFVIFVTCLAACMVSIYQVYKKWERSPVIVNFANRGTPIYNIPFPAVTICSEAKSNQNKFNYTKLMEKKRANKFLTTSENKSFEYMSLICEHLPELNYTNNKTFSDEFYDFLHSVKPNFNMHNCTYMGESKDCSSMFVPIITDDGLCYTFNIIGRSEMFRINTIHFKNYHQVPNITNWFLEDGYHENAILDAYPNRAYLSGVTNGLTFNLLTPKADIDYACRSSLQGYRVLLHAPMAMPRPSHRYFRVPLGQSVLGEVLPVVISTSDSVKAYSSSRRRCYFPTERYMKYFKIYTATNCKIECLTNYTLRECGCVNYFMPRQNGTKICGSGSIQCMHKAKKKMRTANLFAKLKAKTSNDSAKIDCNCLPICSDLTYESSICQTDINWEENIRAHRNLKPLNGSRMSSLTIFFMSDHFIRSERNELYGPVDFLANFGGVLGLFTGFSVLSLVEILYFLTLRIVFNKRLYGRWSGKEN